MRQLTNFEMDYVSGGNDEEIPEDDIITLATLMAAFTLGGAVAGAIADGVSGCILGGMVGGAMIPFFFATTAFYYVGMQFMLKPCKTCQDPSRA